LDKAAVDVAEAVAPDEADAIALPSPGTSSKLRLLRASLLKHTK